MSRDGDMPDEEKTKRTLMAEAAELRSVEAEARAQEAKSIASRALPKSAALAWGAVSAIVSVLCAVIGGTWWVSSYLASKADAKTVAAIEQREMQRDTKMAVLEAVLGEMKDDVKEIKRMVRQVRDERPADRERRGR